MSQRDDGGSAFPEITTEREYHYEHDRHWENTHSYGGMSLRDYFAAKAMQALISTPSYFGHFDKMPGGYDETERAAKMAYDFADSMLKARK